MYKRKIKDCASVGEGSVGCGVVSASLLNGQRLTDVRFRVFLYLRKESVVCFPFHGFDMGAADRRQGACHVAAEMGT